METIQTIRRRDSHRGESWQYNNRKKDRCHEPEIKTRSFSSGLEGEGTFKGLNGDTRKGGRFIVALEAVNSLLFWYTSHEQEEEEEEEEDTPKRAARSYSTLVT